MALEFDAATLAIRLINLTLWLLVCYRVLLSEQPVSQIARRMIATVIVFGMSVFVFGALVPFGFSGPFTRMIYTAFTTYAAIVAFALLRADEPNGHSSPGDGDAQDPAAPEAPHGFPVEVDQLGARSAPIDEFDSDRARR